MKTLIFTCLVTTIAGLGGLTRAAEPPGNVLTHAAASAPPPAASAPAAAPDTAPAPVAAPSESKGAEAAKPSSTQPKPVSGPTCGVEAITPMTFCLWSASTPDRNASQAQPEPLPISAKDTLYVATVGVPGTPTCTKAKLALNNVLGLEASCMVGPNKDFHYVLQMNDTNRDAWRRFLALPSWSPQTAEVTFSYDNVAFDTAHSFKEQIQFSNGYGMRFGTLLVLTPLLLIASFGWLLSTTALRDQPLPQMRAVDCPYSLAKTQMALWTLLHVAAFLLIMLTTGDMDSLKPASFVLMGISSATALGAVAVGEMNKDSSVVATAAALAAKGLDTRAKVNLLFWTADAQTSDTTKMTMAIDLKSKVLLPFQRFLDEKFTQEHDAEIKAAQAGGKIPPAPPQYDDAKLTEMLKAEYDDGIVNIKHKNWDFFRDLVTNGNWDNVLHRWQIVIWTLVLGFTFVVKVVMDLTLPNFSDGLLTLMGISGATYVGFKFNEASPSS